MRKHPVQHRKNIPNPQRSKPLQWSEVSNIRCALNGWKVCKVDETLWSDLICEAATLDGARAAASGALRPWEWYLMLQKSGGPSCPQRPTPCPLENHSWPPGHWEMKPRKPRAKKEQQEQHGWHGGGKKPTSPAFWRLGGCSWWRY